MNFNHRYYSFYITGLVLMLVGLGIAAETHTPQTITIDQLADICEAMESAIEDITIEYEWLVDSSKTLEEKLESIADKGWALVVGPRRCKMVCRLVRPDQNDPDVPLFDKYLFEDSHINMIEPNEPFDMLTKRCYDGHVAKQLDVGGYPRSIMSGLISRPDSTPYVWVPNPVNYLSILRFKAIEEMSLSSALRQGRVSIDNIEKEINGFNTIRADFIQAHTNKPFRRIYFSVEHGYTPVRYEYLQPKSGTVHESIEINSLEEVSEGLWFPSSGAMIDHNSKYNEANLYQATSKIIVNQGLTDEVFDIGFPVGTKVHDKIQGKKYIVK